MTNVRPLKARISNAGGGVTRVDVYDDIGPGGWFSDGVTAKSFAAQLADVTGALHVHINSGGGDVFDGLAIKNAIESHNGPVTTIVDGIAASIASVIAQAGADRVMMPGSMMMIHDAFTVAAGNAAELAKTAQTLDEVSQNLAGVYARAAGGTVEDWRAAMQQETWYTAEQAVQAGLATRVGTDGGAVLPPGFDPAAYSGLPGRIAAQLRELPRAAADGSHGPFTGTHSHAHAAYGAQSAADGHGHEHEHSHAGDADHDHTHAKAASAAAVGGAKLAELVDGRGFVDLQALADELRRPAAPAGSTIVELNVTGSAEQLDQAVRAMALRSSGRVLGMESMPIKAKALPVHHTATVDSTWDGPAAVKAMPNDDKVLRYCHAWMTDEAAAEPSREGDDDADDHKGSYAFPHHKTEGGPANLAACRNGLSRLPGSTRVPEAQKAAVRAHLQAHLDDAKGDDEANNHAELPHWLRDDTTPIPGWLNTAEEATK